MNAVTSAPVAMPKVCSSCGSRYPQEALFCPLDGAPLHHSPHMGASDGDPYLGREILGHIEISQLAGIGAMGRVYRAFQRGIDRDVAVKILHRELSANQQLVARFHREAKVASRLQHANVVHVYLTGQLPDGAMYIVMEYLDGMSLQSAVAAGEGAMPLPRALHIALQLCDAAGEAHAQGIVHRDIKPENVMLVRRGDDSDYVKVLDFGIARLNWGEQSMATAAGLIFGTARYISPEGAQGEQVGPSGDVYAIATMLYQMISGRTPFEADSAVGLLVQQIHDPPPHIRSIPRASYLPEPLAQLIMRNLAKAPQEREADGRRLGRALLEAAKASGLSADDLLAHPSMLGSRNPGPVRVESKQRTRALLLDVESQEKLAGMGPPYESGSRLPSARPHASPSMSPVPSNATTKWTPPPGFQERLAPPGFPVSPSVDPTLDEMLVPPARVSEPAMAPRRRASTTAGTATRADRFTDEEERATRGRGRVIMVVLMACFTIGVIGAVVAYKLGVFGSSLDKITLTAWDALMHQRWDSPPGENVKDITNDGLQQYPNDPQLLSVRELACDEIVKAARAKKTEGDIMEAIRLLKLGNQLDPKDDDAKLFLGEYQRELEKAHLAPPPAAHPAPSGSTTAAAPHPSSSGSAPVPSAVAPSHTDLVLETPVTVRAGLGADFVGRVLLVPSHATRPRIDGASFVVTGPGLAARISAIPDDAGAFRAHHVFPSTGRFEVVFSLKANGAPLRASRTVMVVNVEPPPVQTTTNTASPPATSATEPEQNHGAQDEPGTRAARPDAGTSGWL